MAQGRYSVKIGPVLKSKTVRTYGSLSFSVVAIAIFVVFAIKPTVENIISIQQQINTQSQTLKALKDKSDKLAQAINNYNSIPDDTKIKLFTLLPNTPNPTCLIDNIAGQAADNKVQVSGFQLQSFDLKGQSKCALEAADIPQIEKNNTANSTLKEIPFTINVNQGYPQLSGFINSLNSSVRLISVESAFFNKNQETQGATQTSPLTLSVTGKVYYYK